MFFKRRVAALVASAGLLAGCADQTVSATQAWVREPVPGSDKSVAYFTLHNHTDAAITLMGARADGIRAIEMHTTTTGEGGVLRMRRLISVSLKPNETVKFAPRGKHLMLFGIEVLSDPLPVQLEFDGGATLMVEFDVQGLLGD